MTTTDAIRESGSITLSLDARHALGLIVERNATSIGEAIAQARAAEEMEPELERAARHLKAMKAIDDGNITREIAQELRPLVAELLDDLGIDLQRERTAREKYLDGDEGYSYTAFGDDSREENLSIYKKHIERLTQEAAWCDAFLTEVAA